MFTLRKNHKKRASVSISSSSGAVDANHSRSSLIVAGTLSNENLILLMLEPGCFKEALRNNSAGATQYHMAAIYNQICSLLVFSLREFTQIASMAFEEDASLPEYDESHSIVSSVNPNHQQNHQITVLIDAPKVPMKALRIVLRACQSALAYKIRQCILLDQDSFLGQKRIALDVLLLDTYDFKVVVCARSKLTKHIGLANLFDLQPVWREKTASNQHYRKSSLVTDSNNNSGKEAISGKWNDAKTAFLSFFAANPSYMLPTGSPSTQPPISASSILRLMRKDRTLLIELAEHDLLDSVPFYPSNSLIIRQNHKQMSPQPEEEGIIDDIRGENEICEDESVFEKSQKNCSLADNGRNNELVHLQRRSSFSECSFSTASPIQNIIGTKQENATHLSEHNLPFGRSFGSAIEPNNKFYYPQNELKTKGLAQKLPSTDADMVAIASRLTASVQKLLIWLGENGERRLVELDEQWEKNWVSFGGCIIGLDRIAAERKELMRETEEKLDELANVDEHIEHLERKRQSFGVEKPKELIILGQLALGAHSRLHRLRTGLNRLQLRLDNARFFKKALDEFHKASDDVMLVLYEKKESPLKQRLVLDGERIQACIKTLEEHLQGIGKCVKASEEAESIFRSLLQQQRQENDEEGNQQTQHMEMIIQCASVELATLMERKERCAELVNLRIERLKQHLQIISCEQLGDQIIDKFNESLRTNNARLIDALMNGRENGERLVDSARKMGNIARILRKMNQLETQPSELLLQRLEALWTMLNRKYGSSE